MAAKPQSHKLQRTVAFDLATSERIDEVLAVVMRAPKSYTGEDVAELQGHGGPLVMQRLLAGGADGGRAHGGAGRVHAAGVRGRAHRSVARGVGGGADRARAASGRCARRRR